MELTITLDGTNITPHVRFKSISVTQDMDGRNPRASFELTVTPDVLGSRYGSAVYGVSKYSDDALDVHQLGEVIISKKDSDPEVRLFRGFITENERITRGPKLQVWQIGCTGVEFLLEQVIVNEDYEGKTDREIIQDAFTTYLPEITTENDTVDEVTGTLDLEVKDWTLRDLVAHLAKLSGASWQVSPFSALVYRGPSNPAEAPFSLSKDPDNVDSFSYRLKRFYRTSNGFANKVTVLGGAAVGGEFIGTAENTQSQSELGRTVEAVVVDREIVSQAAVDLAAQIELEKRGVRQVIELETDKDGLEAGQLLEVHDQYSMIGGTFQIQKLSLRQRTFTDTVWTVTAGDYEGELQERLRELDRLKGGGRKLPEASAPAGGWTTADLAAGAVTETELANDAVTSPKLIANAVIAGKIATNAITAEGGEIADLTVTNAKIANATIQNAKIANATITGAKIASATIENGNIANATITGAKIASATITDANIANATITSAKIASLSADKITAGSLSVAVSITTGGSITATSGSNSVSITPGLLRVDGSANRTDITQGDITCKVKSGSSENTFINPGNIALRNTSGVTTLNLFSTGDSQTGLVQLLNSSSNLRVSIAVVNSGGNGSVSCLGSGTTGASIRAGSTSTGGLYVGGNRVVGPRQTDPGSNPTTEQLRQVLLGHGLI